jgi:hypothetical protein
MLALRTAAMLDGLGSAQAAITQVQGLDDQLGERFADRFKLLADPVQKHFKGAGRRKTADDARYLADGERIIAEALAFLGGATARKLHFDDGVAALAQAWLDRLSREAQLHRVAVVVPAPEESAEMESQIVRLKVPVHGVWGLPVAVHEYGHFVASELKDRGSVGGVPNRVLPVESLLHGAGAGDEEREGVPALYWHGHELFADAVASTVTGPAYLRYCLRYRFDPALAHKPEGTHPSPAVRVRMQLAVLDDLANEDEGGYLRPEARRLADAWETSVAAAAPRAPEPNPELDELARKILEIVRGATEVQQIRYANDLSARALADRTSFDADPAEVSVAQVLNAAWVCRDRIERGGNDVSKRVSKLAESTRNLVTRVLKHG